MDEKNGINQLFVGIDIGQLCKFCFGKYDKYISDAIRQAVCYLKCMQMYSMVMKSSRFNCVAAFRPSNKTSCFLLQIFIKSLFGLNLWIEWWKDCRLIWFEKSP